MIKAQPLGGITAALRIAAEAGLPVVVSSALDTSVGISMGLALAAALPTLDYDCGLATAALLAADVTDTPLIPVDGALPVSRVTPSAALLDDPRRRPPTAATGGSRGSSARTPCCPSRSAGRVARPRAARRRIATAQFEVMPIHDWGPLAGAHPPSLAAHQAAEPERRDWWMARLKRHFADSRLSVLPAPPRAKVATECIHPPAHAVTRDFPTFGTPETRKSRNAQRRPAVVKPGLTRTAADAAPARG